MMRGADRLLGELELALGLRHGDPAARLGAAVAKVAAAQGTRVPAFCTGCPVAGAPEADPVVARFVALLVANGAQARCVKARADDRCAVPDLLRKIRDAYAAARQIVVEMDDE
jgi:hypothetical protein